MTHEENALRKVLKGIVDKFGAQVCQEWREDPRRFVAWAQSAGYAVGKYLQRHDVKKMFSPDNCFWTSVERQAHTDLFITYDGRTQSAVEWSRETGINYDTLVYRWKTGKTPEQIFSKAPLPHPGRKKRR